jgi:hypothetical protein
MRSRVVLCLLVGVLCCAIAESQSSASSVSLKDDFAALQAMVLSQHVTNIMLVVLGTIAIVTAVFLVTFPFSRDVDIASRDLYKQTKDVREGAEWGNDIWFLNYRISATWRQGAMYFIGLSLLTIIVIVAAEAARSSVVFAIACSLLLICGCFFALLMLTAYSHFPAVIRRVAASHELDRTTSFDQSRHVIS